MALVFIDGFDHYPASECLHKYTSGSTDTVHNSGRFGGSSYRSQGNRSRIKTLTAQGEWFIGFAWQPAGVDGSIISWLDSGTMQCDLYYSASGGNKVLVRRN